MVAQRVRATSRSRPAEPPLPTDLPRPARKAKSCPHRSAAIHRLEAPSRSRACHAASPRGSWPRAGWKAAPRSRRAIAQETTAREPRDLPDARDGLTRKERVVLWVLHELERELGTRASGRTIAVPMIGRDGVPRGGPPGAPRTTGARAPVNERGNIPGARDAPLSSAPLAQSAGKTRFQRSRGRARDSLRARA
jgi:hypothetical protein